MTTSLQASETISAALSTAPRVSLEQMEARIADKRFFTVGEALTAMAKDAGMLPLIPHRQSPLHLLTVCVMVLDNGWVMIGKSAPASAENFNEAKGQLFAYEDAIRQLWPLEGYLLRERLWIAERGQASAHGGHEPMQRKLEDFV
jgi:hypothetical protein